MLQMWSEVIHNKRSYDAHKGNSWKRTMHKVCKGRMRSEFKVLVQPQSVANKSTKAVIQPGGFSGRPHGQETCDRYSEPNQSTSAPSVRTTPKSEHIQTDTNNFGADCPNPSEKHNRSTETVRTWVPKSQHKRQ